MKPFYGARKHERTRLQQHDIKTIAAAAPIVQIAERGGVTFDPRRSRFSTGDFWGGCPFHKENTPSFHVVERAGQRYFRCHGCGAKGDAIELAMRLYRISFREAVRVCSSFVEMWPAPEVIARREQERRELEAKNTAESAAKLEAAKRIYYAAGGHVLGTPGESYLRGRAIQAPLGHAELRYHPRAPLNPYNPDRGERCPAIVAPIRTADGAHVGTHCTFIRPDGSGKAELPHLKGARLVAGEMSGGCIRLGKITDTVVVAEGIESALSAAEAFDIPAIASISAGNMAKLIPPPNILRVIVAFDRDKNRTGENAANDLAKRLWAQGVCVELAPPPEGFGDWNDAAQAQAREATNGRSR